MSLVEGESHQQQGICVCTYVLHVYTHTYIWFTITLQFGFLVCTLQCGNSKHHQFCSALSFFWSIICSANIAGKKWLYDRISVLCPMAFGYNFCLHNLILFAKSVHTLLLKMNPLSWFPQCWLSFQRILRLFLRSFSQLIWS